MSPEKITAKETRLAWISDKTESYECIQVELDVFCDDHLVYIHFS